MFLVTFKVRVRACGPKITPPPLHNGERGDPARARPVPFCFHGFLLEKATSIDLYKQRFLDANFVTMHVHI